MRHLLIGLVALALVGCGPRGAIHTKLGGPSVGTAASSNPSAPSGTGTFDAIVAANTTSVSVDPVAGNIYQVTVFNNGTTVAWLKLYNATQASTTCGAGTPKQRIMIPGGANGGGATVALGVRGSTRWGPQAMLVGPSEVEPPVAPVQAHVLAVLGAVLGAS